MQHQHIDLGQIVPQNISDIARAVRDAGGRLLIVGGLVRDLLLGRPSDDVDCEVYGIEAEALRRILSKFGQVEVIGDFGVFWLHVGDEIIEIALPRCESKRGRGYKGFEVVGDPYLSYREAFRRRDLTINSMGLDPLTGEVIDPFDGQADLKARILRATDERTFGDDPIRVLRLAYFRSRFGFDVAPETMALARSLRGELDTITVGKLRKGTRKLLMGRWPGLGLQTLQAADALDVLYPIWGDLAGIEQDQQHHNEDALEHTILALNAGAEIVRRPGGPEGMKRFAVMAAIGLHDVGKAVAGQDHAAVGAEMAAKFLDQFNYGRITGEKVFFAEHVAVLIKEHMNHLNVHGDKAIHKLARRLAGFDATIAEWEMVVEADYSGRRGFGPSAPARWIVERAREIRADQGEAPRILTGDHLKTLGWKPGPLFGMVLDQVYQAQISGEIADEQQALALAMSLGGD